MKRRLVKLEEMIGNPKRGGDIVFQYLSGNS
jgi:hypothetical protein